MTIQEPLSAAAKLGRLTAGVGVPSDRMLHPSSTKVRIRVDISKLGEGGWGWGKVGVERIRFLSTVVKYPYVLTIHQLDLSLMYFILWAVMIRVI